MQLLNSILLTLQIISSILIIVLVLLQQGKGADMGAAFGSGSAGSVFGSAGAANFLSRMTKWAAIVFFVTTGGLAWVAHHPSSSPIESGIMSGFSEPAKKAPAAPVAPTGTAVPNVPSKTSAPATNAPAASSAVPQGKAAAPVVPAAPTGDAVPSVPPAKK
ncbi:MAG: preprotein translocase subunit SecG [Castellaniella sp.]|uniref:preprotein translocase subunit SecG n=1 Tax=Castellaniella sp. TaxID=1955812 RepID=UPI00120CE7B0|nr:preprotein translocase subunit SecG [Castellaniella sp.]TAN26014.1 MAG: preprotein translocase subunit SecG [Castellaniella sp.]